MKIGDTVQVRPYLRRKWTGKIGKVVRVERRPYGRLVDVEFEGGEVRTFGGSSLMIKEEAKK